MSTDVKIILGVILVTLVIIGGGAMLFGRTTAPVTVPMDKLVTSDNPVRGNADAPVTMVEFGDFQCPACKASLPIIEETLDTNKDKVKLVFRHFPLEHIHEFARAGSRAAEAAKKQGKFWEMYDLLYDRQEEWVKKGPDMFSAYAKELGLNVDQFTSDMKSDDVDKRVAEDMRAGNDIPITQTPTIFINGTRIDSLSVNSLTDAINAAVAKK